MDTEYRVWSGAIQTPEKWPLGTFTYVLLLSYHTRVPAGKMRPEESFAKWSTKSHLWSARSRVRFPIGRFAFHVFNSTIMIFQYNMPILMPVVSNHCKLLQNFSGCNLLQCSRLIWLCDYYSFIFRNIARWLAVIFKQVCMNLSQKWVYQFCETGPSGRRTLFDIDRFSSNSQFTNDSILLNRSRLLNDETSRKQNVLFSVKIKK